MSKYKKYFQEMVEAHPDLFAEFKTVHDNYVQDKATWKAEFNTQGEKVVEIIHEWEQRLCNKSEGGKYGKFSANLADKFWQEVRVEYPKIDFVGVM